MSKKVWTKESFIDGCNEQMANICDPKRVASLRCKKGAKRYKHMERKAEMKKRGPRDA